MSTLPHKPDTSTTGFYKIEVHLHFSLFSTFLINRSDSQPLTLPIMTSHKPTRQLPPPAPKKDKRPYITPFFETILCLGIQHVESRREQRHRRRRRAKEARSQRIWKMALRIVAKRKATRKRQRRKHRVKKRHATKRRAVRAARRDKLTRNRMSMEQMLEERDARWAGALKAGLLVRRKGESREAFVARMSRINREFVSNLWEEHQRGIREAEPRYLEGWPVRETIRAPVIHWGEESWMATGRRGCVQCFVRGLPCSLTRWRWKRGRNKEVKACTRCVRNGERHECLIGRRKKTQEEEGDDDDGERKMKKKKKKSRNEFFLVDVDLKYPESVRNRETLSEELEAETAAVLQRWRKEKKKAVVDIMGSRMQEVKTAVFVLPRPKKWLQAEMRLAAM